MDEAPQFQHYCDTCTFLGRWEECDIDYDLYFCPQHKLPTVIARFGNVDREYLSGLALADTTPPLGEAKRRTIERGLLK